MYPPTPRLGTVSLLEVLQKRVSELETENARLKEDVRRFENSRRIQASENAYWREKAGLKNTHPDADPAICPECSLPTDRFQQTCDSGIAP